jgi:hypothetical protein
LDTIKPYADCTPAEQINNEWYIHSYVSPSETDYAVITGNGRNRVFQWDEVIFPSHDKYDIKISRRYPRSTDPYAGDSVKLDHITEITDDSMIYPNTALLGVEIRATEQLSGSPPNITALIRGIKVEVPSMSVGNFNDVYWNETNYRWENNDGNEVLWDGSTLAVEYTENFAAHIRNILLNERYGAGRYLKADDINTNSWVEIIKDCHLTYDKYDDANFDYCAWWDTVSDNEWTSRVAIKTPVYIDPTDQSTTEVLMVDVTNRKIYTNPSFTSPTGTTFKWDFEARLEEKVSVGNLLDVELTFANHSNPSAISVTIIIGKDVSKFDNQTISSDKITITHTQTSFPDRDKLRIMLSGMPNDHLTGELTDIVIKRAKVHVEHFHEANGIMERAQAADSLAGEFCHSFRCWVLALGKQIYFKSNKDETPIHTISETNIIEDSFQQTFTALSTIPYLLEAQFSDRDRGYEMNQVNGIVPVVEANKATTKQVGLKYITDIMRVNRELIFHTNVLANTDNLISFKLSSEFLHAAAGDVIKFYHSLPNWGSGQSGRIVSGYQWSNEITLDQAYTFNNVATNDFTISYQNADNDMVTADIDKSGISEGESLTTITVVSWLGDPLVDGAYIIGIKDNTEQLFRLVSVKRDSDKILQCLAANHEPTVYTSTSVKLVQGPLIPPDDSYQITIISLLVNQLYNNPAGEGLSFVINATGIRINYFVLEMSDLPNFGFTQLVTISGNERTYTHIFAQGQLVNGKTYYFRVHGRNDLTKSNYGYSSVIYNSVSSSITAPTGLRLFGPDPLATEFNTTDVTFLWNPSNVPNAKYLVEIYDQNNNLLTSTEVFNAQFIYTLSDNVSDSGGSPNTTIGIQIATRSYDGVETSPFTRLLTVTNRLPAQVSNLNGISTVGGAIFSWTSSNETDHKAYYIRTKVETNLWTSWFEHSANNYTYQLSSAEIAAFGTKPTIYIEVSDKDWYEQVSGPVGTSAVASEIGDNVFDFIVTLGPGVSGDGDELFDGNIISGGVNI